MPPAPRKTLRRLFTESARKILASGEGPASIDSLQIPVSEYIQPVVLVTRGITTDTQTLDPLMNSRARIPVDTLDDVAKVTRAGFLTTAALDLTADLTARGQVVEDFESRTGANLDSALLAVPDANIYKIVQIVGRAEMAAVAGTRTYRIAFQGGLT